MVRERCQTTFVTTHMPATNLKHADARKNWIFFSKQQLRHKQKLSWLVKTARIFHKHQRGAADEFWRVSSVLPYSDRVCVHVTAIIKKQLCLALLAYCHRLLLPSRNSPTVNRRLILTVSCTLYADALPEKKRVPAAMVWNEHIHRNDNLNGFVSSSHASTNKLASSSTLSCWRIVVTKSFSHLLICACMCTHTVAEEHALDMCVCAAHSITRALLPQPPCFITAPHISSVG